MSCHFGVRRTLTAVTVEFHYMTGIDWHTGRGYTTMDVNWLATFTGRQDKANGRFLAVVWENFGDPIITGRSEIGQPNLEAGVERPLGEAYFSHSASRCFNRSAAAPAAATA